MFIIRYFFLSLILICCTSIGWIISKKYKDRVIELKILQNALLIMQNKIKFTRKPLQEIFNEISKLDNNQIISVIFYKIGEKLKNKKIGQSIDEAFKEEKSWISLKEKDIKIFKNIGNMLGKTDVEGQMDEINQVKLLLDKQIEEAELEEKKNCKMYKSLGTIVGLMIMILLF